MFRMNTSSMEAELASLMGEVLRLSEERDIYKQALEKMFEGREGGPAIAVIADGIVLFQLLFPFPKTTSSTSKDRRTSDASSTA